MRRAYIEVHCSLGDAYTRARQWAGKGPTTIISPSTGAVAASPWLEQTGVPIGTNSNRRSRYTARPRGTVIAWCLHLDEILEMERWNRLDGVVAVRAMAQHAPWITAHHAEHLAGEVIAPVAEASPAIKATVDGLSGIAVLNQGLTDSRERSEAVQALTYLRHHGHRLDPDQLATEALRSGWPGTSPLELAAIATDLNAGKSLRHQKRLMPDALATWASGEHL